MSRHASAADDYHPWTTYIYAREEARRRGDRRVGTEHLVLGLLREPVLGDALGCELGTARATLEALDRSALAAIGVESSLDAPPVPTREPAAGAQRPTLKTVWADRLPLTPAAKTALQESSRGLGRRRRIDPCRVLLAVLSLRQPDPGADLLDALDINREAVCQRLTAPPAPGGEAAA
jgi:hypothetical protein